jgi:putative peptide zinc metalloprotease protein
MMFIASVTTVLFNINPLMRYDGYYILSDLLDMPNLQPRSTKMLVHLCERYLFGVRTSEPPTTKRGEGTFLAIFGLAGWLYRLVIFVAIALFVSEQFLLLGVILALYCVFSFTVKPLFQLIKYLGSSPKLSRTRARAVLVTGGAAAAALLVLGLWPAPNRFRAPGILRAEEYSELFTSTPGTLAEILAQPGSAVVKGQPLLRLVSRELQLQLAAARASLAQAEATEERALTRAAAELEPLRSRRALAQKRVARLEEQERALVLTAPHAGTWVSQRLQDRTGQWFPRGHFLGQIVQAAEFRFSAVISQDDAANLFTGHMRDSEVRVAGEAGSPLRVGRVQVIPGEQEMLPSSALGWLAGGDVAVSHDDPQGRRAAEPFFELRAHVEASDGVMLLHGRSGKIRVELAPEPLLAQWYRKTRQLFQKKYQI